MAQLTEFELHQLETHPAGACELVFNEAHFSRVIRDGMARARISLDIMTADFKAMLIPHPGKKIGRARTGRTGRGGGGRGADRGADSIVHLFRRLAERGVEIRILHGGTPSGPALQELKLALSPEPDAPPATRRARKQKSEAPIGAPMATIAEPSPALKRLTLRRCPRVHAKAVIIDARAMYLGSANLTGAGLGAKSPLKRNFEMGIWTESAPLIEAVSEQFNMLWEGHRCAKCLRKDICPVPLEEPRL